MARRTTTWALLGLTALAVLGCANRSWIASETVPRAGAEANVLLYLSNQSWTPSSVTMAVYVDGRLTLRQTMRYVMAGGKHGFPEEFKLRLSPGAHAIRVQADGLAVSATTDVVVGEGTLYVDAAYYHRPKDGGGEASGGISIQAGNEPPGFC